MLDHLKALLAVAGGVVGVGGGAVTLALRQSNQHGISTTGGGESALTSSSVSEAETHLGSPRETINHSTNTEQVPNAEDKAKTLAPTPRAEEEEKENCSIVDSKNLGDVFYELIDRKPYLLISCAGTNKDSGDKWSKDWAGLFPSELFVGKSERTKFKLVTETTGSSDNGTVTFSSETLSPSSITGKGDEILQAQGDNKKFLLQTIKLTPSKSGDIFLIFEENVRILKQIIHF